MSIVAQTTDKHENASQAAVQTEAIEKSTTYQLSEPMIIVRIVSCLIPLFGLLLNLVVSLTLLRVKGVLPPNAALLMFHQSFIDGINSVFFFIVLLPVEPAFPDGVVGLVFCIFYVKMVFATDAVAQINAFVISIERYHSICRPLRPPLLTKQRIVVLSVLNWVFCGALCYGMAFLYVKQQNNGYCGQDKRSVQYAPIYAALYASLFYVMPMVTMLVCYSRIMSAASHSATAFQARASANHNHKALVAARRLTRTLIIASCFLVVTNVPDIVLFMFMYCVFGMDTMAADSWTYSFQIFAKSVGPVINPVVYSFAIPRFRFAVKYAFCSTLSNSVRIGSISNRPSSSVIARMLQESNKIKVLGEDLACVACSADTANADQNQSEKPNDLKHRVENL